MGTLICATGFFLGSLANTLPWAIITLGFMIGIFNVHPHFSGKLGILGGGGLGIKSVGIPPIDPILSAIDNIFDHL